METIESIKEKYVLYIQQHAAAYNEGSAKVANRIHKKIMLLAQKAKKTNQMDSLLPFLENENEDVRLWTASIFLQTYPETVLIVLNKLTESTNYDISFKAKGIVDMYKKGIWEKVAIM